MGDTIEDDDWTPPTAADMKIIEARQERSNQISKLMGNYMLKGYRMLDKVCDCGTIFLQDRNGTDYCVACNELETECAKDDPVLSPEAARVAVLEGQKGNQSTLAKAKRTAQRLNLYQDCGEGTSSMSQNAITAPQNTSLMPQVVQSMPRGTQIKQSTQGHGDGSQEPMDISNFPGNTNSAYNELQRQIATAASELKDCSSIELRIQLCNLIKSASEAIVALNNANRIE